MNQIEDVADILADVLIILEDVLIISEFAQNSLKPADFCFFESF